MKLSATVAFLTFALLAAPGLSQYVHPAFSAILDADAGFDKNRSDFDILSSLIKYADFAGQFSEGIKLTLLAPTDAAFMRASMAFGTLNELAEENAYNTIVSAVKSGVEINGETVKGPSLVKMILAYHIIGGRVGGKSFDSPGFMLTTLQMPILAVSGREIVDLSIETPNARFVTEGVYESDGLLVNSLDYVLFPFDVDAETFMKCPAVNPKTLVL